MSRSSTVVTSLIAALSTGCYDAGPARPATEASSATLPSSASAVTSDATTGAATTDSSATTTPGSTGSTSATMTSSTSGTTAAPDTTDGATTTGSSGPDTTGSTGAPGGCPASEPVLLSQWSQDPWVAPDSGDAQVDFVLSQETWKHYERFELDLDVDVTTVQTPYTCFLELRNKGAQQNETWPWRYFSICTKNENPKKMVYVVYAAEDGYLTTNFTLKANTTYHVHILFDAALSEASLTMTEDGGEPVAIVKSPLNSSIVPQGQGLNLLVGFKTSHPDYPTIKPPWGWTFRDLEVTLEPGGPHGDAAPPCE